MSNNTFRKEWLRFRAAMVLVGSAATLPLLCGIASAADADTSLEEIIVTGSSIKGAAPVGSNLITVGREQLEEIGAQTVQQGGCRRARTSAIVRSCCTACESVGLSV